MFADERGRRLADQIVTHGDEAGAEVVWVHHAVPLLQRVIWLKLGLFA